MEAKIQLWHEMVRILEMRLMAGEITPDQYDTILRNYEERIGLKW
jgi:hypothetical protein